MLKTYTTRAMGFIRLGDKNKNKNKNKNIYLHPHGQIKRR